ncbi:MAG TPA: extracellular solute-binding protein, partial [Inquilinus sp.]
DSGKIVLDQPENRAAMIEAVKGYSSIFTRGCTPPSSVNWLDTDNNVNFHNKTTVLTHNATISIPSKHLDDSTNQTLTEEQRAQAKKNYEENIRTTLFPKKPDGGTLPNLAATKTAVIFADSKNKAQAKEFMAFMMKDENLTPFVEGSVGRWYPVTKSGAARPFWTDGSDPHRAVVSKQFTEGTVPFPFVYNYHFTTVNAENVWAKALNRVVQDGVSPDQAVDEMIARIKEIAG